MYQFQAAICALPNPPVAGENVMFGDHSYAVLAMSPQTLNEPLTVSFEQAAGQLEALPRMFFEPDGSWVWVGEVAGERWQVDGCLYDRGDRLQYVDIQGRCPVKEFNRLLACFGWPEIPLAMLLTQLGVLLAEEEFRRWAEAAAIP